MADKIINLYILFRKLDRIISPVDFWNNDNETDLIKEIKLNIQNFTPADLIHIIDCHTDNEFDKNFADILAFKIANDSRDLSINDFKKYFEITDTSIIADINREIETIRKNLADIE